VAELLGVADGPDAIDPVAGDVEREHGQGAAVLLSHQSRPAVDRALHQHHGAERPVGNFCPGAGDLLAAFDGAQEGDGEPTAVGDCRGINRVLILNAEPRPGRGTVLLLREAIGF